MKLNTEELNLLLDGCQDTLHRLKYDEKVNESFDKYTKKVIMLKKRIETSLESKRRITEREGKND